MGETRWTPGPWNVGGDPGVWLWIGGPDDDENVLADIVARDADGTKAPPPNEVDEANAALMASAPNLYSRLAARVTNCPCVIETSFACPECVADRKVMARARGGGENDG